MADAIPGARFAVIEDSGHLSNLEAASAFDAQLADFLGQAWPAGG
jgi:pimeloyl-ACP methyl ester carboxylesterase